jgi:hypothetical protein
MSKNFSTVILSAGIAVLSTSSLYANEEQNCKPEISARNDTFFSSNSHGYKSLSDTNTDMSLMQSEAGNGVCYNGSCK